MEVLRVSEAKSENRMPSIVEAGTLAIAKNLTIENSTSKNLHIATSQFVAEWTAKENSIDSMISHLNTFKTATKWSMRHHPYPISKCNQRYINNIIDRVVHEIKMKCELIKIIYNMRTHRWPIQRDELITALLDRLCETLNRVDNKKRQVNEIDLLKGLREKILLLRKALVEVRNPVKTLEKFEAYDWETYKKCSSPEARKKMSEKFLEVKSENRMPGIVEAGKSATLTKDFLKFKTEENLRSSQNLHIATSQFIAHWTDKENSIDSMISNLNTFKGGIDSRRELINEIIDCVKCEIIMKCELIYKIYIKKMGLNQNACDDTIKNLLDRLCKSLNRVANKKRQVNEIDLFKDLRKKILSLQQILVESRNPVKALGEFKAFDWDNYKECSSPEARKKMSEKFLDKL